MQPSRRLHALVFDCSGRGAYLWGVQRGREWGVRGRWLHHLLVRATPLHARGCGFALATLHQLLARLSAVGQHSGELLLLT